MIVRTDLRAGQGSLDLSTLMGTAGKAADFLQTANVQAEEVTNFLATAGVPTGLLSNLPATLPSTLPTGLLNG